MVGVGEGDYEAAKYVNLTCILSFWGGLVPLSPPHG